MAASADPCRSVPMAQALGGAGLIPFAVMAAAQWLPVPGLSASLAVTACLAYGAVILSFLGGVRWGAALDTVSPRRHSAEVILSALPALAGWVALLLPQLLGVSLLIAGFLLQAQWDVMSAEQGRLPSWFGKLRMLLTAGAVLALIAMLVRLLT